MTDARSRVALAIVVSTASVMLSFGCKPPASSQQQSRRAQPNALCADKKELCQGPAGSSSGNQTGSGYLLSHAEVEAISELVESYRNPQGGKASVDNQTTDYDDLRAYLEDFLNRAMRIDALKPGRSIKVHIRGDDSINAFADGFQNVGINRGYIKNIEAKPFMATLCHELAHSTRNHVVKRVDFQSARELADALDRFDVDSEAFFAKAYDVERGIYTHDRAGYQKLAEQWKQIGPRIGYFSKRTESEADVIGGMICSSLGMPADDFIAGYREEAAIIERLYAHSSDSAITADALRNGESFEFPMDAIFGFLFPVDSHPTDKERESQLKTVRDLIDRHLDAKQGFYAEWKTEYGRRRGLGLASDWRMDLAEVARHQTLTATTSGGRIVRYHKPKH